MGAFISCCRSVTDVVLPGIAFRSVDSADSSTVGSKPALRDDEVLCIRHADIPVFRDDEVLCIRHADIPVFRDELPDSLRVVEITYSGVREFAPSGMGVPPDLVELDLSFNRLREIPRCLWDLPRTVRVNLRNNDMWFAMHSGLSPAMISRATVRELVVAHRLGLVSTHQMGIAHKVLLDQAALRADSADRAASVTAADMIARAIGREVSARADHTHETHVNAQNVHLRSVQDSALRSARFLMRTFQAHSHPLEALLALNGTEMDGIRSEYARCHVDAKRALHQFRSWISETEPHSVLGVTFADVLSRVVSAALQCPCPEDVLEVVRDEMFASLETCKTGRITRVINALGGFVPGIVVSITSTEELTNSVLAIRRKFAAMYSDDPDAYVREAVPAVWQLLEDACVPEAEHSAWLDSV